MNETTSHATTIGGGSAGETVEILRLRETARLPRRGSERAAGYDLYASEATTLPAARVLAEGAVEIGRVLVPTGLAMAIPKGLYGRVAPRSGLAVRRGIDVGAGVIDSDYRDELLILLFNLSAQVLEIREGDRIAQIVFERIATPTVVEVDSLPATDRSGGFGSTGLR